MSYPLSPAEPHTNSLKRKQRFNTNKPRDLIGIKQLARHLLYGRPSIDPSQERGYEMNIETKVVQELRNAQDGLLELVNQLGKLAEQTRRGFLTTQEARQQQVSLLGDVINASRKMTKDACDALGL